MIGEIKAGRAFVEITAKDKTQEGLASSQASLRTFANTIGRVSRLLIKASFVVGTAAAVSSIKAFVEAGKGLNRELSQIQALGPILSSEDLDRAQDLATSLDAVAEAYRRIREQAGKALAAQGLADIATGVLAKIADDLSGQGLGHGGIDWQRTWANLFGGGEGIMSGIQRDVATARQRGEEARGAIEEIRFQQQAAKDAEEAAKRQAAIQQQVTREVQERQRLIQQFETDHERFLRREQEIMKAINQLHRSMILGSIGGEFGAQQRAGLDMALARLRAQEQQRIADGLKRVQDEQPEAIQSLITSGSRGTFSARGAGLLGFGTRALVKTEDKNGPVIVKNLVELNQNVKGLQVTFK